MKEDIFGVCVLNVYFRIPLGGSLMSSWFIFTFDLNLVLLSGSCGEHCMVVGCRAGLTSMLLFRGCGRENTVSGMIVSS